MVVLHQLACESLAGKSHPPSISVAPLIRHGFPSLTLEGGMPRPIAL
jgi:hypothetical protein